MTADAQSISTLDIVVPIYNEAKAIESFYAQLRGVVDKLHYEVVIYFIDDGSTDNSCELLRKLAETDGRVRIIELSRNFGHQAALTAGLDLSQGDVVITMDGDGQHPPELIPKMLQMYQSGYDIVLTQRTSDQKLPFFKRKASMFFYWLLNRIGNTEIVPGAADYRLLSRSIVEALKQMGEYHRFLRGMISWMGYRSVIIPYVSPERLGGRPKYSVSKMAKLAIDAIFSFSLVPLQIGIFLGLLFFALATLEVIYVLSLWLQDKRDVLAPGWSSLMFMILIVGGIIMIIMGIIGAYVGYVFQQVKLRPIYLIKKAKRASTPPAQGAGVSLQGE